jgi:hypothetical protein
MNTRVHSENLKGSGRLRDISGRVILKRFVENMLCEMVEYSHPTCGRMCWWVLVRTANILRCINDGKLLHQKSKYHIITDKAVRVRASYYDGTGASWLNISG